MRVLICSAVLVLHFATAARAVDDYDDCLQLVETSPEQAQREAGAWARYGGGAPARHCYALALLAFGAPSRAIDELIGAATEEPGLPPEVRTDFLVQAGELLLDEEDFFTASIVAEQALRLTPRSAPARALRGIARARTGNMTGALDDLDEAIDRGGPEPEYLLRRAATYRMQGNLIAARDDASYATEIDATSASAWLELGRIQAAMGDRSQARKALLDAIELDRDGRVGTTARTVLQRMEAGVE